MRPATGTLARGIESQTRALQDFEPTESSEQPVKVVGQVLRVGHNNWSVKRTARKIKTAVVNGVERNVMCQQFGVRCQHLPQDPSYVVEWNGKVALKCGTRDAK
jgi:hypothetical protein